MIVTLSEGKLVSNKEGPFLPLYFRVLNQTASLGPLLLLQPETAVSSPRPVRHQAYDRARLFHYFGDIEHAKAEAENFKQQNPLHYDAPHLEELIKSRPELKELIEISTVETIAGYCQHLVFGKKNLVPKLREFDPYLFRKAPPTEQYRLSYEETAEVDDELIKILYFQQTANEIIGEIRNMVFYDFLIRKTEYVTNSVEQGARDEDLTKLKRLRTSYIQWVEKIILGNKKEKDLKKAISKRATDLGLCNLIDLPIQPVVDMIRELKRLENQVSDLAKKYEIKIENNWHENITLWKYSQNGIKLRQYSFTSRED